MRKTAIIDFLFHLAGAVRKSQKSANHQMYLKDRDRTLTLYGKRCSTRQAESNEVYHVFELEIRKKFDFFKFYFLDRGIFSTHP